MNLLRIRRQRLVLYDVYFPDLPVNSVDDFIAGLEGKCVDTTTLYKFGTAGETFDVPVLSSKNRPLSQGSE